MVAVTSATILGKLVDRVQRLIPSAMAGKPARKAAEVGTMCQMRSTSGAEPARAWPDARGITAGLRAA